jgi:hypothetical protein
MPSSSHRLCGAKGQRQLFLTLVEFYQLVLGEFWNRSREPVIAFRFHDIVSDEFCKQRRKCIAHLNSLVFTRPFEFNLIRESLETRGLTDRQCSIQPWMNGKRVVARDKRVAWLTTMEALEYVAEVFDLFCPVALPEFLRK